MALWDPSIGERNIKHILSDTVRRLPNYQRRMLMPTEHAMLLVPQPKQDKKIIEVLIPLTGEKPHITNLYTD